MFLALLAGLVLLYLLQRFWDQLSILLSLVGERGVLVTQYDRTTSMRVVRLYATEVASRIGRIL